MKLVSTRTIPPDCEESLFHAAPDLDIVIASPSGNALESFLVEIADADVVMGSYGGGSGDTFQRVVRAAKTARWIHTTSAGIDEILCPEVYEREFILTCAKGHAVASLLAEHAMALLLAVTRRLVEAARYTSWERGAFQSGPIEIAGLTMGIVGFGAVARALAKRALAFDMRVLGIRTRASEPPPGVEAIWGPDRLPDLLAESDVVVLILPNTERTEGSFGEEQLRQMKESAILVNVGRGQVMDGPALEKALVEGRIAGAGLDVMPEEPWSSESPLWRMPNVLITPHIAGNGPQRAGRDIAAFCDNFHRFVRGEPLKSVVDLKQGY